MLEATTVTDVSTELTDAGAVPGNGAVLVSDNSGGVIPCDDCHKPGSGAPELNEASIDGACLGTKGSSSMLKLD